MCCFFFLFLTAATCSRAADYVPVWIVCEHFDYAKRQKFYFFSVFCSVYSKLFILFFLILFLSTKDTRKSPSHFESDFCAVLCIVCCVVMVACFFFFLYLMRLILLHHIASHHINIWQTHKYTIPWSIYFHEAHGVRGSTNSILFILFDCLNLLLNGIIVSSKILCAWYGIAKVTVENNIK